jgi:5-methylcytosine-specific restriction enzyme A
MEVVRLQKPLKPCSHIGCPALVKAGKCPEHSKAEQRRSDAYRGNSTERGYGSRWQKNRLTYLQRHPLCAECEREGKLVLADVVDHVIPHKGDQSLFWDVSNWQSLCKRCHDIKTSKEDGGFGRGR